MAPTARARVARMESFILVMDVDELLCSQGSQIWSGEIERKVLRERYL